MEKPEELKQMIRPILEECQVNLYDLKWTGSGKNRTLEISIVNPDGTMDLDTCAAVSERLSEFLDTVEGLDDAYTLEVCSPGAEREIHDIQELAGMTSPYVYLRLHHSIDKKNEYTGEVTSVDQEKITVSYKDKTRTKEVVIPLDEISYIRLAVHI